MNLGCKLVIKTVKLIEENKVQTIKQSELEGKLAPKIFNDTCKINWNDSIDSIYNLIRGLNPYPAAWTYLINNSEEIKVKIFDVKKEFEKHQLKIGTILSSKKEIKVAVTDGYLIIDNLQLAGKRKMDSKSLLNGFTFNKNAKFC